MNISPTHTVAEKLALTLEGLMRAVAACSDRRRPGGAMAAWLIRLIWTRVSRSHQRIQGLLARFQAGRLRVRTAAAPVARVREGGCERRAERGGERWGGAVEEAPPSAAKLPRRPAWLLPLVPCEAANFASQLRLLLAEPEMVALLNASPQARRVLAPLCRMLGIEAEVLHPASVAPGDIAPASRKVDPPEVALAWNLGVVLRPGAEHGPPGGGGWKLAQPP